MGPGRGTEADPGIHKARVAGAVEHDMAKRSKQFGGNITKSQATDTGMALVLICLILFLYSQKTAAVLAAIVLLGLNMIWPLIFAPVAVIWLGLANILGTVVSKIVLTLIFYLVVTPVGLIRRLTGADPMKLKLWKQGPSSVFSFRNHRYEGRDVENPY